MYKHEFHNLVFHDDAELSEILGEEIESRTTVHEWPLSSVQKIRTRDGRKAIYKSQWGPTVEPEFYAAARTDLLPAARTLYRTPSHACMLIDFIDAPRVQDVNLSESDLLQTAEEVVQRVERIGGDLPYSIDIGGPAKWLKVADSWLADLRDLLRAGAFMRVRENDVEVLKRCVHDDAVLEALSVKPVLLHGDLGGDNIFITKDGCKVIDWQRPILGPPALGRPPSFVAEAGVSRLGKPARGIELMQACLVIGWCVDCKRKWIPDGGSYDGLIAQAAGILRNAG